MVQVNCGAASCSDTTGQLCMCSSARTRRKEAEGDRHRGVYFCLPVKEQQKLFFSPKLIVDKQNLSIIFQLSKVRLLWQQAQQGVLDVLVPSSTLQFLLASPPSWACPKPPQLALLDMKEQRLCSELPQHVWVPLLRHPGARPARACNPILLVTTRSSQVTGSHHHSSPVQAHCCWLSNNPPACHLSAFSAFLKILRWSDFNEFILSGPTWRMTNFMRNLVLIHLMDCLFASRFT